MSPVRRRDSEPLTDDERAQLEVQTRRNLDGMDHEAAGRADLAMVLYEQNVAEGFEGDWPYSRLVSLFERDGRFADAERILARAIEVTRLSRRRPAADRRAVLQGLQGRMRILKKNARAARERTAGRAGRSFVPLPMIDASP